MGVLVPWPGIEPASPVLDGEFFTTGPPGESLGSHFLSVQWVSLCENAANDEFLCNCEGRLIIIFWRVFYVLYAHPSSHLVLPVIPNPRDLVWIRAVQGFSACTPAGQEPPLCPQSPWASKILELITPPWNFPFFCLPPLLGWGPLKADSTSYSLPCPWLSHWACYRAHAQTMVE